MANRINISREALTALLQASGSPLTPEEYLASLPDSGEYKSYPSRARAAALSKSILIIVAVLSAIWICLPIGFSIEGVIIVAGLVAVTFFEYRVHRYFREENPKAPGLGFRNQACFATGILIYGLYHALFPHPLEIPAEYQDMIDPSQLAMIPALERVFYLVIGGVGFASQFGLAWYYRSARIKA